MKLLATPLLIAAGLATLLAPSLALAQESTEELIKRLRGSAGKKSAEGEAGKMKGLTTRGIQTRGLNARSITPARAPKTQARSLYFSTRGVPKAVQIAAEKDKVKLETTTAKKSSGAGDNLVDAGETAVEVKYDVDPDSKVTKDNILFQRGSSDFADDASFRIVNQLATALKDSSLDRLKYVIEGHASAEGSAGANQALSQRRAEKIVSVLGSLGVSQDRLLPIGFGETQARFPDHSREDLLRHDRRVLIFRLND